MQGLFDFSHCNIINIELVSRLSIVEAASIHFSSHLTVNDRESRCLQTVFFLERKEDISCVCCLDSSSLFWTYVFVRFEVVYWCCGVYEKLIRYFEVNSCILVTNSYHKCNKRKVLRKAINITSNRFYFQLRTLTILKQNQ